MLLAVSAAVVIVVLLLVRVVRGRRRQRHEPEVMSESWVKDHGERSGKLWD